MNYHNALTEIESINTTHLSAKGSEQVLDFKEFVEPLIPDIKRGEAAKAKIAEYYLEHKATYTEGAVACLEPLVQQLGVSGAYISQIKKAKEFKQSIHNPNLKQWVEEHPITVQYRLAKAPHQQMMEKFMSGEHCSQREVERFTRVDAEAPEVELEPCSEPTLTEYQEQLKKQQDLIDDIELPYIHNHDSAKAYLASTTSSALAVCMEKINRLSTCDEDRRKQLLHLIKLAEKALELPAHYQHNYFPK